MGPDAARGTGRFDLVAFPKAMRLKIPRHRHSGSVEVACPDIRILSDAVIVIVDLCSNLFIFTKTQCYCSKILPENSILVYGKQIIENKGRFDRNKTYEKASSFILST